MSFYGKLKLIFETSENVEGPFGSSDLIFSVDPTFCFTSILKRKKYFLSFLVDSKRLENFDNFLKIYLAGCGS